MKLLVYSLNQCSILDSGVQLPPPPPQILQDCSRSSGMQISRSRSSVFGFICMLVAGDWRTSVPVRLTANLLQAVTGGPARSGGAGFVYSIVCSVKPAHNQIPHYCYHDCPACKRAGTAGTLWPLKRGGFRTFLALPGRCGDVSCSDWFGCILRMTEIISLLHSWLSKVMSNFLI